MWAWKDFLWPLLVGRGEQTRVLTVALGVFLLGGIQLLTIGILGEYVGRIFMEVKARPVAVVAEVIASDADMVARVESRSPAQRA